MFDKQSQDAWDSAEVKAPKGQDNGLPPGKYVCRVSFPEIFTSKDGRNFAKISLVCDEGTSVKLYGLDDPSKLKFIKQDLATMGVMCGKLNDLPKAWQTLSGKMVDVSVVQKGEYKNIYINGLAKASTEDKKDVPF